MSEQSGELRETVRRRYAAAAAAVPVGRGGTACCGPQAIESDDHFGGARYAAVERDQLPAEERDQLPAEAVAASLGCGNPTAAGCIAGALSFDGYRQGLEAAGFPDIAITPTHAVADGMHAALVRAAKPIA